MLGEEDRRRCEKLLANQESWFVRVGLDWVALAMGVGFVAIAAREMPAGPLMLATVGGFACGGGFARLFLARDLQLLARLYRECSRGQESAGA